MHTYMNAHIRTYVHTYIHTEHTQCLTTLSSLNPALPKP